jgi:ADP-ribose pyrophosphatase YjhB (NUDIX family)
MTADHNAQAPLAGTRPTRPLVGVGVLVWRGAELLLVKRAKPPAEGQWSLPGGSQELGETLFDTAAREVAEETAVTARPTGVLTAVDSITYDGDGAIAFHYTIIDVMAEWQAGEPVAADDALDARWATADEALALVEWAPLRSVIRQAAALREG